MASLFYKCVLTVLIFMMIFPVVVTKAITNDFTTRAFIGIDTTPPSVPTGLTAIPVATSQIDLAWLPSTDDIQLMGYHVWRDNVLIATTTSPLYVDTGLTASTTYTYFVSAYDQFFNESATSTAVATTTLSIPVVPPSTTSGTKYGFRLSPFDEIILSLEILPQKDSVIIRYETSMYIQSVIKWGKTTSYELGSLAEQALTKKHETNISGLTPGTQYKFTIEGNDKFGREGTLHTGTFTTLPPDDIFPPGNVTRLTATRDGTDVVLSWKLPEDPDLASVRVVRSDRFYPSDIADGWVVYEGLLSGFRDAGAAVGTYQFYTVFSYDTRGNISSGAVVRVQITSKESTTPVTGTTPSTTVSSTSSTTDVGKPNPARNTMTLSFDDIRFIQEGIELPIMNDRVEIDGAKQLTIALPYTRVPEHLKTILVVLGDSTDEERTFQFLLRANTERTAYTSTLAPLGVSGTFPVSVSVFDFSTAQIGYASGSIDAYIAITAAQKTDSGGFLHYLISFATSYVFWFVLMIIVLMFVGRRLLQRES